MNIHACRSGERGWRIGGIAAVLLLLAYVAGAAEEHHADEPAHAASHEFVIPKNVSAPPKNESATPKSGNVEPKGTNSSESADTNSAESILLKLSDDLPPTANIKSDKASPAARSHEYELRLGLARSERKNLDFAKAETDFLSVVNGNPPEDIKKAALSELGVCLEESKQYAKAQKVYVQWVRLYPDDPGLLEILLRQGLLYREMGANGMALAKFYSVMATALNLKLEQLDYYKRLVLRAQTEVAETFYLQGKYSEAAEKLKLLLKLDSPYLNRGTILFKLIRCSYKLESFSDVSAKAQLFLKDFPDAEEQPEVRFLLANSLKKLGRTSDCLEQVGQLLKTQQKTAALDPDSWRYWQQRTGNEIANMLYQEGDYLNSLQIYSRLSELDTNASWQLPVLYQVGLVYEQLKQPDKANDTYGRILARDKDAATETLKTIIDMAKWRQNRLNWQAKAEKVEHDLGSAAPEPAPAPAPAAIGAQ